VLHAFPGYRWGKVLVLGMIRAVQVFDEVFVLTGGGPGSATTFIVQYIYQTGFAEAIHQYGLAAAASLVLALSLLLLTLVQLRLTSKTLAGKAGRDDA
jgi:alpha-1,4-digalacturonate transport system permease protein